MHVGVRIMARRLVFSSGYLFYASASTLVHVSTRVRNDKCVRRVKVPSERGLRLQERPPPPPSALALHPGARQILEPE